MNRVTLAHIKNPFILSNKIIIYKSMISFSTYFYPEQLKLFSPKINVIVEATNSLGFSKSTKMIMNKSLALNPSINVKQLPLTRVISTDTSLIHPYRPYPNILFAPSIRYIPTERFMSSNSLNNELDKLLNKKTLKTINNKVYETALTEKTTINDLTNSQLIEELLKRELVKVDDGATAVKVKLEDGSDYLLGSSKNKLKLSSLGQAYNEKSKSKLKLNGEELPKIPNKFIIIVPPEKASKLFIETGTQKHLVVVSDDQGNYYAIGYMMTSKNSGVLLSEEQFKKFQDIKEGNLNLSKKEQRILFFDNAIKIESKDIKRVKWDAEYIKTIPLAGLDRMYSECKDLEKKPYETYDATGITKEECLKMCIEHDKIASTNGKQKHPLSADQVKQNEYNKEKQKAKLFND